MSTILETKTLVVSKEERTKQIVISTPKDQDPVVEIYRERITSSDDGAVLGIEPVGVVSRSLSEVADKTFVVGEIKLTGIQIAGIISTVADQLRQEDMRHGDALGK